MAETQPAPRDGAQRKQDALARLAEDVDLWVSTAGPDGEACLVPLSFVWHDSYLLAATRTGNPTTVNARRTGRATLALGHTRDVVLIEADADILPSDGLDAAEGEQFVAKLGWDPRGRESWSFLRFRPRTIRAWREVNEQQGRYLMTDGTWLV
ncbi:pyridoxamine 5'-phosphate oxidase family protein [Streptomyces marincola]|uniref:pyridoxamine 5'-phosphate oxidase family protein n=1 Tax=Streptomyces marincola TaxID=2878388 RepID=UPI001CF4CB47|nr:pyridoxamine 5'-phosphate oxidase family protein [Streptomyces marincola]UCM87854.1 pyridoxamine 5'-phosphate oxidase [Streptomyces marincola]